MRILVCGSRHFTGWELLCKTLNEYDIKNSNSCIISGGARGTDMLGERYAEFYNIPFEVYEADWNKHGKAAGSIRNKQMLDEGKPDLVIAFLAPNSRGTKNMIAQATKAGVPVKVIEIEI